MLHPRLAVTLLLVIFSCAASVTGLQLDENARGVTSPAETMSPYNGLGQEQAERTVNLPCGTSYHPKVSSTPVLIDQIMVILDDVPTITTPPEMIGTGMVASDYEWMDKRDIEARKKKQVKLPKTSSTSSSTSTRSSAHRAIYHNNLMSYSLIGIAVLLGLTLAL